MAQSLYLSRDVKVYVEFDSKFWEIPVLDGFSFSQSTNVSDVTVAEMANSTNTSRRGRRSFTDSVSAAEFSFSTYARPYIASTKHHAVEEVLWALFAGAATYDPAEATGIIFDDGTTRNTGGTAYPTATSTTTDLQIEFTGSNKLTFAACNVWFKLPGNDGTGGATALWYKLTGAVFTEASCEFDLEGITTISWSGMAQFLTEESAPSFGVSDVDLVSTSAALTSTSNFIRNRLTQLVLDPQSEINSGANYNLTLTGGNISFTNEVSFVTPESLGIVNKPLGHVMGSRQVSGSFTCYLNDDSESSAELMQDLLNASSIVTNHFDLTFKVGGDTAPRMEVNCPKAHLQIPTHAVADVISVEVSFNALPSDIGATDEATVKYVGTAL